MTVLADGLAATFGEEEEEEGEDDVPQIGQFPAAISVRSPASVGLDPSPEVSSIDFTLRSGTPDTTSSVVAVGQVCLPRGARSAEAEGRVAVSDQQCAC